MADKIVQLINKDGDNIYPIASVPHGASITMTTTDPGEGSALAADSYIGVYGGDPIIMDYSTTEVNTGMKWIDGSAIYKKTVNFGALPSSGVTKTVAHGIVNLGYVIKAEGFAKSTGGASQVLPIVSTSSAPDGLAVWFDGTNISMATGTAWWESNYTTSYMTLYYTKSS